MDIDEFSDIPYSSASPLHKFDLYLSRPTLPHPSPLLCYVHGGAWRAEDKANHVSFARQLCSISRLPVVVPNYRLTPTDENIFRHPGHAQDILQCLSFLTSWGGVPGRSGAYDPSKMHLIGHSCAAHMLSCIFLDSSLITPSLTPSESLLQSVKSIALFEGIYDLDLLLERFPGYRKWFVEPAFGALESYGDYAVTKYPLRSTDIHWLVIHSLGDTLVNLDQSKHMYEHLQRLFGDHSDSRVSSDFDTFKEDHHNLFNKKEFVELLGQFPRKICKL